MTATSLAIGLPDADASFVARQLHVGLEHNRAGMIEEAIAAYQRGLAAAEDDPGRDVPTETIAELHSNIGNACTVRGDIELAADNYKAALRLAPHLTACWCNLGTAHLKTGKPQDAIACYGQALKLDPGHWPSLTNLVQALLATQQYLMAKVLLMELLVVRPQDPRLHNQLGKVHFELNELESAIECFQQAVALDPRDTDSIYWIGGVKQKKGEIEAAEAAYAEAARMQPLIRRPAAKSPADFRVLALFAPFAGNLPTEYLFKDSAYDTDTLALFASCEYDAELLKRDVQVVVNLVSDADQAGVLLPLVADLVARLDKPTVNDPRKIQRTTRDAVANLLEGIPGLPCPEDLPSEGRH